VQWKSRREHGVERQAVVGEEYRENRVENGVKSSTIWRREEKRREERRRKACRERRGKSHDVLCAIK